MNWRALAFSFFVGVAIDMGIVWLFYWWNGAPYRWSGFWIWQAILFTAGLLLWVRRLLGVSVFFLMYGRHAVADEVLNKCLEFELNLFDPEWDSVEGWLGEQVQEGRTSAVVELLGALLLARQQGIFQYLMVSSAYRKGALRYSNHLKRRYNASQV